MDKNIIRAMAKAERMMDSGELSFVWAPSASGINERLAITKHVMEEFDLVSGQNVNSIIRDAIISYNLKRLQDDLTDILDRATLDSNFDFRDLIGDNDEDDD